jgi:RNA polymerase sigma-70 factor (ECF subfamily)
LELILEGLSPEHRAVFVMFEIEGISCQEIAEQTGIAVGTVYSRLHTARKQIQQRAAELLRAPLGGGES